MSERCGICEERFTGTGVGSDEQAEMYDPATNGESALVHAQCGLSAGWEVA